MSQLVDFTYNPSSLLVLVCRFWMYRKVDSSDSICIVRAKLLELGKNKNIKCSIL